MRRWRLLIVVGTALSSGAVATPARQGADCRLTPTDKAANVQLSFNDFDQVGTSPATGRRLADRGCYIEAAEATEDYLVNGPVQKPSEQRVLLFHLAQQLALAGYVREAARFVGAAKNVEQEATSLDWNSFVEGTWAFLVRDRAKLVAAREKLEASDRPGDKLNMRALAGLENCFGKSYREASGPACRPR